MSTGSSNRTWRRGTRPEGRRRRRGEAGSARPGRAGRERPCPRPSPSR
nr:MAG TPA: hypothetical protein [Caudoviricetes sp.]